jgi:biopolymer transport protein ExbB
MPTQTDPGVWFYIDKGGVVMLIIIALSIIAFTIALAKFWSLWHFRAHLEKLGQRIQPQLIDGNVSIALNVCREYTSPVSRLFEAAILYRRQERSELTRRLERLGGDVVAGLESYLGVLAAIIGVAPMLGFLGTIIGLIRAFRSWEAMGDQITINMLSGGIYEAMLTTAAGLSVTIPYYLIYSHLTTRAKNLTRLTEEHTETLVDLLIEPEIQEPVRDAV